MDTKPWVLRELDRAGAVLLRQHFVYKSGKHGSGYINMDPIFPDTELMWRIGTELWLAFRGVAFGAIAAPATGGIALAYAAAYTRHWEVDVGNGGPIVDVVWADKVGDDFAFERAGFAEVLQDERLLVVEDLLTTGGSVIKTCRAAEALGAEVVGVSAVVNRGGVTAEDLGVPRLESLASVNFEAVAAEDCPLCRDEVPIVSDVGHGAAYKEAHPDYPGGYVTLLTT
jgi:orotate phosphoribosyltransferase